MYSACVRASTQCRQFPNSDKLSTGGLNEERNSESLFLSCMMSSTEFSVNALGMSPGHVHMTNMTLWGYVRKCAETHCLNYRMAKNGSVEVIFISPSSRRRRSISSSIRNVTTYTMCFLYGRVLGSEGAAEAPPLRV